MTKYNPKYLDDEEKTLIEAYNKIELSEIKKPSKKEQILFKNAAKNYIKQKESKMNIRIDSFDLQEIKQKAMNEGLKYSTWVKMVLHKYLKGQLVEKKMRYKG